MLKPAANIPQRRHIDSEIGGMEDPRDDHSGSHLLQRIVAGLLPHFSDVLERAGAVVIVGIQVTDRAARVA